MSKRFVVVSRLAAVLVTVLLARPARAQDRQEPESGFGFFFGTSYGIGRNLNPEHGPVSTAYTSTPSIAAGLGEPGGLALTLGLVPFVGHRDQTTDDLLLETSIRIAPEKVGGIFGSLGVAVSPTTTPRDDEERRTVLAAVHGGFAIGVAEWDLHVAAGLRLGDHREDGFVAIPELRFGLAYVLPWERLSSGGG